MFMKKNLIFLMVLLLGINLLLAEEFTMGGIYVQLATENQSCNFISRTTNIIDQLKVGKTYHLGVEVMEIKTKANESVTLVFSNGLILRVQPNSIFSIDSCNQLVVNYEDQPSALKSEYSITSLSLMEGDVELICPKFDIHSQCILQTPLVNVNLNQGKLSIRANPKYVMLNTIEGAVTVIDSKNKSNVIDKGNLGLIIPFPGRENEMIVTQKTISPDELRRVSISITDLEKAKQNVFFAIIDKKIVGIRLK